MERVKNEYVAQNQPNAQVGNVAYINQSKQVAFGSPQDLQITTYNTNRIAGPEGYRNNFYEIDSVPNIAFFGPDYNGTYSAVHRQEMIDYVNQNAGESLGQEIAQIKQEQEEQNNKINQNKNLIDSTYEEAIGAVRKNAEQDETIRNQETRIESNWNNINNLNQRVGTNTTNIQTNTNNITALDGRLLSVSGLLNQTIDGLRTLKPFEYVGEYQNGTSYKINQLVSYNNNLYLSKEDNNTTTPPSDKWLLLNEDFASINLNDYYTKLEVEGIKNNLQNSITSNTTNITNLTNRTNTIEQNYVSKTTTTPQTIASQITFTQTDMVLKFNSGTNNSAYLAGFKSNNQRVWYFGKGSSTSDNFIIGADRGVIKLEPSTHVDVSNKKIINIADPTADQDAANKRYVDNKVNTNTTNITTIRNNYLDKTSTGVQQIAASSVYFNNQVIINQPYNASLTPNADFQVSGQGFIENLEADNATFNTSVSVPTPTQNDHAANKQYVDNAIQNITPGSGGSIDTSNFATLNTNQTISGQKTFTNRILANGGITNLPLPTNTNDAANKQYVDRTIDKMINIFADNTQKYSNLQTINVSNLFSRTNINYNKPLIVSFTRYNGNSNTQLGTHTGIIYAGTGNKHMLISDTYVEVSNGNMSNGSRCGLLITPNQIKVQCWNGGDKIGNIVIYGWAKALS